VFWWVLFHSLVARLSRWTGFWVALSRRFVEAWDVSPPCCGGSEHGRHVVGIVDGAQNRLAARGPSCPNGSTVTGTRRYGLSSIALAMSVAPMPCWDCISQTFDSRISHGDGRQIGLMDRPWFEHFEGWRLEALGLQ